MLQPTATSDHQVTNPLGYAFTARFAQRVNDRQRAHYV